MKKFITIFAFVLLISTSVFAQSLSVNISGGVMFISVSGNETSRLELNSNVFSSSGNIIRISTTNWSSNCNYPDCQPGTTFITPCCFNFYDMHERGNFTVNGTTHENVWYQGTMDFTRETFLIPRITRRKGLLFFQGKFQMNGIVLICQINSFVGGCPADKIIFQGNIAGHGKMIVRLRSKLTPPYHWFRAENYEYRFEP